MSGRELFEHWACMPIRLGELLGLSGDGLTPLVLDASQPGAGARPARTVVDLHRDHIGRPVVLMFEDGDPKKPIVLGVLRGATERPESLGVEPDGDRLVISAQRQLVLRCGRASITLTKEGKVLIEGAYLLSNSTGANRIKGGSVQLN